MRPSRPGLPATAILPLRLFLGVMFLYAGLQKFNDPMFLTPNGSGSIWEQLQGFVDGGSPVAFVITHLALPHARLMGQVVAWAEIWIGIAAILGVMTSLAALGGLVLSLTFFLTASWSVRPFFLGADLPFAAAWLTLLLAGPGAFSLDSVLIYRRKRGAPSRYSQPAGAFPRLTRYAFLRGIAASVVLAAAAVGLGRATTRRSSASGIAGNEDLAMTTGEVVSGGNLAEKISTPGLEASITPAPGSTSTAHVNETTRNSAPAKKTPVTKNQANADWKATRVPGSSATDTPKAGASDKPASEPTSTAGTSKAAGIPAGFQVLAAADAVPFNSAKRFTDPATGVPGIVVHMPDDSFVAFNSKCTHEGCKVRYNQTSNLLRCPCHDALFDPADAGAVRQGPAKRALKPIDIRVGEDGNLYVKGS